jgi:hypothetical protein
MIPLDLARQGNPEAPMKKLVLIVLSTAAAFALFAATAAAHTLTHGDAGEKAMTRAKAACYAAPSCYMYGYYLPCQRWSRHEVECQIRIWKRDRTGAWSCGKWVDVKISPGSYRPWVASVSQWRCTEPQ